LSSLQMSETLHNLVQWAPVECTTNGYSVTMTQP
jgi:hypothetical protein